MRGLTSWWRPALAALVLAGATLAAGVHLGAADSEEEAAGERKPESNTIERERAEEAEAAEREMLARKLKERFEQLQHQLRELRPEQRDLAEKMEHEMREIRERVQELMEPRRPEPDRERDRERDREEKREREEDWEEDWEGDRERERWMHRLRELKEAMVDARASGRREEAGRLEREFQEIMELLRERSGPARLLENEETQRLRHLRQAVENLRAGGFHDLAERVRHEAERRLREARVLHLEHPDRPRHVELPHGAAMPKLQQAVRELREEVRRLHHEVEELREHIRRSNDERRDEED